MNLLETLAANPLIHRFGYALVHFLWQGLAIAVILSAALQLLGGRSPGVRYLTAWVALLGMAASVPITARLVAPPTPPELASIAAEPSTMQRTIAAAETGAGVTGPDRVDRRWNDEMAEMPLAPIAVESPAVVPGELHNDAPPSADNTLGVRISQSMRPALPWIVYGWLAGVFVLSLWRLGGWMHLRRLCRFGTSPAPEATQQMLGHLLGGLRVRQAVQLLESTLVKVPTVIGWLRPMILLPVGILAEMPPQQLEMILAHELAHVRRYDFLLNLLQTAVETLLFYHPAVWWVSRRIRIEREACCDDLAAAAAGNRLLYARALTKLAELRHEVPGSARAGLNVAADGAPLLSRIRRVLGLPGDNEQGRSTWLGSSVAVLLLIGALVGYAATAGERQSGLAEKAAPGEPQSKPAEETGQPSNAKADPWRRWTVTGKATNENGRGLEGVTIRAHSGVATLFQTGEAVTDKEGKYALRFGPGFRYRMPDEKTGKPYAGLQAATISAFKPGYFEKNLYRQGNLRMAEKLPPRDSLRGAKPEEVILPGKPRGLDFVMVPAAVVQGTLVDDKGKPIAGQHISLLGKKSWPSTGVLAWPKTGENGEFSADSIPTDLKCWFEYRDVRTGPTTFAKPGPYAVRLLFTPDTPGGKGVLEIVSIAHRPKTEARARQLKSQEHQFTLVVAYHAPKDNPRQSGVENPYRCLILHTAPLGIKLLRGCSAVRISEEQAARIIDHLKVEGFLAKAVPLPADSPPQVEGPAYSLRVGWQGKALLHEVLGWDLKMLHRLEGFRKVLDGNAATAMDRLLAAFEPQRKQWEAADVSITGQVSGIDGKPAVGYRVTALPKAWSGRWGSLPSTITDKNGLFTFRGLPDGPCDVAATSTPLTNQPNMRIKDVVLKNGKPVHVELPLEQKCHFGGRVTNAADEPQPNRNVLVIWKDPSGRAKYSSNTKTDSDGRYRFASPFSTAELILLNDENTHRIPKHHDVEHGRDDVDFRLDGSR